MRFSANRWHSYDRVIINTGEPSRALVKREKGSVRLTAEQKRQNKKKRAYEARRAKRREGGVR